MEKDHRLYGSSTFFPAVICLSMIHAVRFPNYQVTVSLYHTFKMLGGTPPWVRSARTHTHSNKPPFITSVRARLEQQRQFSTWLRFCGDLLLRLNWYPDQGPFFLSPKHLLNKCIDNGVTRLLVLRRAFRLRLRPIVFSRVEVVLPGLGSSITTTTTGHLQHHRFGGIDKQEAQFCLQEPLKSYGLSFSQEVMISVSSTGRFSKSSRVC